MYKFSWVWFSWGCLPMKISPQRKFLHLRYVRCCVFIIVTLIFYFDFNFHHCAHWCHASYSCLDLSHTTAVDFLLWLFPSTVNSYSWRWLSTSFQKWYTCILRRHFCHPIKIYQRAIQCASLLVLKSDWLRTRPSYDHFWKVSTTVVKGNPLFGVFGKPCMAVGKEGMSVAWTRLDFLLNVCSSCRSWQHVQWDLEKKASFSEVKMEASRRAQVQLQYSTRGNF